MPLLGMPLVVGQAAPPLLPVSFCVSCMPIRHPLRPPPPHARPSVSLRVRVRVRVRSGFQIGIRSGIRRLRPKGAITALALAPALAASNMGTIASAITAVNRLPLSKPPPRLQPRSRSTVHATTTSLAAVGSSLSVQSLGLARPVSTVLVWRKYRAVRSVCRIWLPTEYTAAPPSTTLCVWR